MPPCLTAHFRNPSCKERKSENLTIVAVPMKCIQVSVLSHIFFSLNVYINLSFTSPSLLILPQQVQVIVDLCSGGNLEDQLAIRRRSSALDTNFTTPTFLPSPLDAHSCRGSVKLPQGARLLNVGQPLQVGGMAHPVPAHTLYGWLEPLLALPFHGCVRNLRVNGQVSDWLVRRTLAFLVLLVVVCYYHNPLTEQWFCAYMMSHDFRKYYNLFINPL